MQRPTSTEDIDEVGACHAAWARILGTVGELADAGVGELIGEHYMPSPPDESWGSCSVAAAIPFGGTRKAGEYSP
ncbi:hypothetical protein GGTG_11465 [Gaeumannomyces tritici R3-111a-1]|uniref:Uncharacterized protein n=1 Tax=Gaeumannomyces tritici (strain R3-111a-1) TaxID=644352 RepID=J3PD97_GAET3|nr:hypothetical protein GGTG_11465 [Gaeumannomyces tritici R3-111a-1]EJT70442.1 hypothetical protein GGTG_11465 [Gaeumannomyces tritici R3-111a-1]